MSDKAVVTPLDVPHINELAVALLRVKVAVDLAPLISTMIEDHEGRLLIVADVVECWLCLSDEARAMYDDAAGYTGLSRFVGDYVDAIETMWQEQGRDNPDEVSVDEADRYCRANWRMHGVEVLRRAAAGEPPSTAWLRRITGEHAASDVRCQVVGG